MRSSDAQNKPQSMEMGRPRQSPPTFYRFYRPPFVPHINVIRVDFPMRPDVARAGAPYYASLIGGAGRRNIAVIAQRISRDSNRLRMGI